MGGKLGLNGGGGEAVLQLLLKLLELEVAREVVLGADVGFLATRLLINVTVRFCMLGFWPRAF